MHHGRRRVAGDDGDDGNRDAYQRRDTVGSFLAEYGLWVRSHYPKLGARNGIATFIDAILRL